MHLHDHDLSAWRHEHRFDRGNPAGERRTWFVVLLTAVMMAVEIGAGLVFGSMALLADGWHMSTHVVALAISGMAYLLARRYAHDHRFAFGTWKIEVLGSYTSAILLGVVALAMAVESLGRFWQPVAIRYDEALLVAVLGLVVNLLSAYLLQGDSDHGEHGHDHGTGPHVHGHHHDLNLRSAYMHVLADAFTSVLAILALAGGKLAGWGWLDPLMGIIGAGVIALWAYQLIGQSSKILLDREMDQPIVDSVRAAIESDGDAKVADLHLWRVGRGHYACIVSLVADAPRSPDEYRDRLRLHRELAHVSIEVNTCPAARP